MSKETRLVRRRKKRKLRKKVVFILVPLIIAFLAVATWGTVLAIKAGSALSDSYENNGRDKSELRENQVDPDVDDVSVLFMGVDSSETRDSQGEGGMTDSLMLATLNKDDNNVKLLNIPRDSYVNIPGEDITTKINEAHAYGGSKKTIDTVEKLLDIPVDYYVKVNFDAFIDVVDALDGVEADVPYELYEQDSEDRADAIHLTEGEQKLDGEEALAFARTRKHDSDVERGKRQQELIKSIMDRTTSMSSVLKYDEIIDSIGKNMKTDMTFDEIKSFTSYGTSKDLELDSLTIDGNDYQPENKYFYQLDEESLKDVQEKLKRQLNLDDTEPHIDENILPNTGNEQPGEGMDPSSEEPNPNEGPEQGQEDGDPNGEPDPGAGEPGSNEEPEQGQEEPEPNEEPE